jgi:hypothetical protein
MNPRKYNLTSVTNPETGKRVTNAKRQKAYRLRKAGHTEEACPLCSAKYCRRQMRCPEFDALTIAAAVCQAKGKEFDRLYAFLSIKDYGCAAAAYKQAIMEVHPDHDGTNEQAQRINDAWKEYKDRNGWTGPAPTVMPVAKQRKTKFPKVTIDRLFRKFWGGRITAGHWRAEVDKLEARYVGEPVMFKGVRERMETTIQHKERVHGPTVTPEPDERFTHQARAGYTFCDCAVDDDMDVAPEGVPPTCVKCLKGWTIDREVRAMAASLYPSLEEK